MRTSLFSRVGLVAVVGLAAGCDNAGVDLGFPAESTGAIVVHLYLDADGSRTNTPLDVTYSGARVALLTRGGDTLRIVTSDAQGRARFSDVVLGQYQVGVASGGLGDSVSVAQIDTTHITVAQGMDTVRVSVRLAYPELTVREARATTPGRRVFLRGVILAGVQSFRDTTSHLSDSSGAVRLTDVTLRGGLAGNSPGDSVSVLGAVASRDGQPTLAQAIIARFGARPSPLPRILSTRLASEASGGTLDADLVQVISAPIVDTATVQPDFVVGLDDGSGRLTLLLDANLNFPRPAFIPGRQVTARGVLVPHAGGGWMLKPRDGGDVSIF